MNLTSNKTVRICVCAFLFVVAIAVMILIGTKAPAEVSVPPVVDDGKIKNADQVNVSEGIYSSMLYVLSDKEFVDETVKLYNSLEYTETDELITYVDPEKRCYILQYSYKGEMLKKLIVTKEGLCAFEVGGKVYKITSDFDFDALDSLVMDNIPKQPETTPPTIE